MNLRTIDPNQAFLEGVQKVIGLMLNLADPEDEKFGKFIPWRTGPDGEVGIPLRVVAEAAGRPVDELADLLKGQTVMDEPALFSGRQGAKERLSIGAMGDELCINVVALPALIANGTVDMGTGRYGLLLRLEAASVANLLERLAGAKAATA